MYTKALYDSCILLN